MEWGVEVDTAEVMVATVRCPQAEWDTLRTAQPLEAMVPLEATHLMEGQCQLEGLEAVCMEEHPPQMAGTRG